MIPGCDSSTVDYDTSGRNLIEKEVKTIGADILNYHKI